MIIQFSNARLENLLKKYYFEKLYFEGEFLFKVEVVCIEDSDFSIKGTSGKDVKAFWAYFTLMIKTFYFFGKITDSTPSS